MKLELQNLKKTYRKTTALKGVSHTLEEGIYGLLGPNGSGKSTLMNIITTNIRSTSGTVLWDGVPIEKLGKAYRAVLGYVPQQQALYQDFTVLDFLYYVAALKDLPRSGLQHKVNAILKEVDLSEVSDYKVRMLSGGMKQRLLIAQAVLGDPKILIMDEPTVGLDPKQRQQMCELIQAVSKGRIVLIATHIVSDLEYLGGEILLMKNGNLIRQGKIETLLDEISREQPEANITTLNSLYLYYFGEV